MRLVGEYQYLVLGGEVLGVIGKPGSRPNIVEIESDDPGQTAFDWFFKLTDRPGSYVDTPGYGTNGGLAFRDESGLFTGLRQADDGSWTIDMQNSTGQRNIKIKFTGKRHG